MKVESAIYRPFGEQSEWLQPDTPAPETKGWIGERYDADAGLQYLNARYYDPALGLFLQPDWFEVTKPGVGTNRFSYSFNDPVNLSDPGGNIVDTIRDLGSMAYDAYEIGYRYVYDDDEAWASGWTNLAIDTASAAVPGVPAGSGRVAAQATKTVARVERKEFSAKVKKELIEKGLYAGKGKGEEVHHIVEAASDTPEAARLRDILDEAGIAVNGVENGVGLTNHMGSLIGAYRREVLERLEGIPSGKVADELEKIGRELRAIDKEINASATKGMFAASKSGRPSAINEWVRRQLKKVEEEELD